jgi:hypothetical protein
LHYLVKSVKTAVAGRPHIPFLPVFQNSKRMNSLQKFDISRKAGTLSKIAVKQKLFWMEKKKKPK